jgi:hypothetical protein
MFYASDTVYIEACLKLAKALSIGYRPHHLPLCVFAINTSLLPQFSLISTAAM